ncbi:MAG TPA: hypothetical protein DEG09_00695 [Marinilabiliaceae bacterium]|nr:hypothetical protein [Marinilabiliaceae bacterium]HBX87116.1 hypothetical protein [Marinilabiliaceae bacterium]
MKSKPLFCIQRFCCLSNNRFKIFQLTSLFDDILIRDIVARFGNKERFVLTIKKGLSAIFFVKRHTRAVNILLQKKAPQILPILK